MPQKTVAGGFPGRAGAHHIAGEGHVISCCAESGNGFNSAGETGHSHGKGVERDIRAAPGIRSRREVIGIDLSIDLEDTNLYGFRKRGARQEPFRSSPGLHNHTRRRQGAGKLGDLIKGVIYQNIPGEGRSGFLSEPRVFQRLYEGPDVEAAHHVAHDAQRVTGGDQGGVEISCENGLEELRLYPRRRVHARRNPIHE